MIEKVIENWHRHLKGEFPGGLDELLADDVVFYSPIVFTPQKGKEITKMYLGAAGNTLGGDGKQAGGGESTFRYTKEILSGNHAMLEFESQVDGKYLNGVDIISCNAEGKISEFRVMIRPLQAIHATHKAMAAMLEKMQGSRG
ncbi:MAG: nuclear transport factor 2 family protein [Deltaproteobacteria bacterium]|nr:nuclear transport factor 2 family protein [Deltaproteobacteria bacterium]MBW2414834.1 nuclear transport factor 2 family protein [Deltaproteobacteria bacterium]